jgi:hypothetical protein
MKRFGTLVLLVYGLYLIKSAMGINISNSKTAPDWLKLPIAPILKAHDHDHDRG